MGLLPKKGRTHGNISHGRVCRAKNLDKKLFDRTSDRWSGLLSCKSATNDDRHTVLTRVTGFVSAKIDETHSGVCRRDYFIVEIALGFENRV